MTTTAKKTFSGGLAKGWMTKLSRIGSALMFPIAVLPVAAILLRIGAELPGDSPFGKFVQSLLLKSGDAVFSNLYIIFAVGVAFAFTKDKRGEAAFAGFIGIMILTFLMVALTDVYYGTLFVHKGYVDTDTGVIKDFVASSPKDTKSGTGFKEFTKTYQVVSTGFHTIFGKKTDDVLAKNVLNGIVVGALTAFVYNHSNNVALPKVLGFFSGKRLVPAVAIIASTLFTIVWAVIFPWIGYVIFAISEAMSKAVTSKQGESFNLKAQARFARAGIMGVYGFLNRLLIPFGLHHIPNNIFWFQLGEWPKEGNPSQTVNGDILIFLQGQAKGNPGGIFQAGFFPMMMFGLPALVGAFVYSAETKEQKIKVASLYGSAAIVSFLTGITEPIEFAFLYVSPLLYLSHAILTGIFAFITGAFGIQLGFGFSAGLLDYITSIPKSLRIINESGYTGAARVFANPGWIFPIGFVTAAAYFGVGVGFIKGFNLSTPGRGEGIIRSEEEIKEVVSPEANDGSFSTKARNIVKAFGGWDNITTFENCSTRLRYEVKDGSKVSEEDLKKAGVFGLVKVSEKSFQAIVGVEAESINNQITSNKGAEL
ncbi:PTS transporter subunit EIIC [Mycoplasma sp. 246B]